MSFLKSRKWQDLVFGIGNALFSIGLLPSVFSHYKPAFATSILTAIILCSFLTVHVSYKLWFAFASTLVGAILWFVLAGQVILS